jgi:hypothetical protein
MSPVSTPLPCSSLLARIALVLTLAAPLDAQAQIASPPNAGGNAGNNASPSSTTPIGTPTFSPPVVVIPTVQGVSVDSGGAVTATPQIITEVSTTVQTTVSTQATVLSPVVTATSAPAPLSGPSALVPDVSVGPQGSTLQIVPLASLTDQVSPLVSPGSTIVVGRPASGTMGTISIGDGTLQVGVGEQVISLPVTQADQVAVTQFAAVAIATGYTSASIQFGAQLVSLGATPVQTLQLMAALQGLANQTNLTSLASGITAFNTIVDTAPASVLAALAENPVFAAANTTLRAARSTFGQ